MNCDDVQTLLHDLRKRRLEGGLPGEAAAHLEGCAACASADRAERALDDVLEQRLPRYAAPAALKQRLGALVEPERVAPPRHSTAWWVRIAVPALAAGIVFAVGGVAVQRSATERGAVASLTAEVVNDHLRVLASGHPLDVESGGSHQVKPWFEGKLDFAPEVPAPEDGALRLRGGSVGYVFDRKAAVIVYALRQHVVTLLAFRADGLAWPDGSGANGAAVRRETARGFNVVLWRSGELGYALVSDVNAKELGEVGARLAAAVRQ